MSKTENVYQIVDRIVQKDNCYKSEAYLFVLDALVYTQKKARKSRDVNSQALLQGIKELGVKKFGPTARMVFEHWGVRTTEDFGRVVFNLVKSGFLKKTEDESVADFKGAFDFREEFERKFKYRIDKDFL